MTEAEWDGVERDLVGHAPTPRLADPPEGSGVLFGKYLVRF